MNNILHDSTFWWALLASVWAVISEYAGSTRKVRENTTYGLLLSLIGQFIAGQTKRNPRR